MLISYFRASMDHGRTWGHHSIHYSLGSPDLRNIQRIPWFGYHRQDDYLQIERGVFAEDPDGGHLATAPVLLYSHREGPWRTIICNPPGQRHEGSGSPSWIWSVKATAYNQTNNPWLSLPSAGKDQPNARPGKGYSKFF